MLNEYRFEVALSFAGENRKLVREVAHLLRQSLGVDKVFYDEWFEAELAGADAQIVLQQIYGKQARLIVPCVSQPYNVKPWTQDEWRAIQALERTLRDAGGENIKRLRILPLRFGDGEVDGIFSTAIVPDVRDRPPESIATLILDRLNRICQRQKAVEESPIPDPAQSSFEMRAAQSEATFGSSGMENISTPPDAIKLFGCLRKLNDGQFSEIVFLLEQRKLIDKAHLSFPVAPAKSAIEVINLLKQRSDGLKQLTSILKDDLNQSI